MTATFPRGQFWPTVLNRTARALACGALQPIPTEQLTLHDEGLTFVVRLAVNLARKTAARQPQASGHHPHNPFLPFDPDLFVCEVTPSHLCLLNKFNVVEHHLLVVTRQYEHQEDLLTFGDFDALFRCLSEMDGLAFYNSGGEAGASQTHKHLQVVPLPIGLGGPSFPFAAEFEPEAMKHSGRLARLPFAHVIAPMTTRAGDDPSALAEEAQATYGLLLDAAAIAPIDLHQAVRASSPYNLLLTREWMMLVPRSREHFESISINALGFTGSLFVKSPEELQRVREAGPASVLRTVSGATR